MGFIAGLRFVTATTGELAAVPQKTVVMDTVDVVVKLSAVMIETSAVIVEVGAV